MEAVDCIVIGAGVVGLACARALAQAGREVLVLEAAAGIGTGTSSRNSEVIHAGIYYPAGSLKAQLCVEGRALLYAYCAERHIPHRRCGKLIVAQHPEQGPQLEALIAKAAANGVHDLQRLSAAEAQALEPALRCAGAVLSPSTGIIDSHAFMLALQGDAEHAGALFAFHTTVEHGRITAHGIELHCADGTALRTRTLINAAGLHAPQLAARLDGLDPAHVPRAWFAKGNYFTLSGRAPFSRLIYPLPEAAGLGVHLTLDLGGQARFGPDVEWTDDPEQLQVDLRRGDGFYAAVRSYWPDLPDGALQPGYAGIRPKISGPHEAAADFRISGPAEHGIPGLVNLFGIESPGLTSALALAGRVLRSLQ